jgi:hypothetical protein
MNWKVRDLGNAGLAICFCIFRGKRASFGRKEEDGCRKRSGHEVEVWEGRRQEEKVQATQLMAEPIAGIVEPLQAD